MENPVFFIFVENPYHKSLLQYFSIGCFKVVCVYPMVFNTSRSTCVHYVVITLHSEKLMDLLIVGFVEIKQAIGVFDPSRG